MTMTNRIEIGRIHGVEHAERRRERGGAGGDRHRHGEHVVGEERDAGDLRGQQPEVVARHHVRAAGRRVGLDRLAVRQDQEEQDDEQRGRDRDDERERAETDDRDEHTQHLLGRVRRRREVVGREHRERGRLAEPLVLELLGVQRRAEQLVLQPVARAVGRHLDAGNDRRGADRRRGRRGRRVASGSALGSVNIATSKSSTEPSVTTRLRQEAIK